MAGSVLSVVLGLLTAEKMPCGDGNPLPLRRGELYGPGFFVKLAESCRGSLCFSLSLSLPSLHPPDPPPTPLSVSVCQSLSLCLCEFVRVYVFVRVRACVRACVCG